MAPEIQTAIEKNRYYGPMVFVCLTIGLLIVLFTSIANSAHIVWVLLFMLFSPMIAQLAMGIPIDFTPINFTLDFPLLTDSSESREYRAVLKSRLPLSHADFYMRFYQETDIPFEVVLRLRQRCIDRIGDPLLDRVYPSDNLQLLFDDLDLVEVIYIAQKEFGIKIPRDEWKTINGTFGQFFEITYEKVVGIQALQS